MAPRYERRLAMLAKIEAIYGTDSAPTGAENAILAVDVNFTPMSADKVSRNLYQTYLGAQPALLAGEHVELSFKTEIAGSGAAGVAPAWGVLLRAAGAAETITEDTMVEYSPVSSAYESVVFWYYLDGCLYKFVGTRGNGKAGLTPKGIPYIEWNYMGLQVADSDAALPTQDLTTWIAPLIVSKTNTPTFNFFGAAAIGESFSLDFGQKVEMRHLIGEDSAIVTDRASTGTMTVQASLKASKDWIGIIRARTQGALSIVHGTTPGNIVDIDCPACEIDPLSIGATQGIVNNTLPFTAIPDEGNDEWVITVK